MNIARLAPSPSTDRVTLCESIPKDGTFRLMSVTIDAGQVQTLTLRSDVLQSDALFLYWGAPDAITKTSDKDRFELRWARTTYEAVASVERSGEMVNSLMLMSSTDRS